MGFMREATQPGQIWCWGSCEHGRRMERMWLILDVFPNCGGSFFLCDGLAIDLEGGEQRPVFNLPSGHDADTTFVDASLVTWRRVL